MPKIVYDYIFQPYIETDTSMLQTASPN